MLRAAGGGYYVDPAQGSRSGEKMPSMSAEQATGSMLGGGGRTGFGMSLGASRGGPKQRISLAAASSFGAEDEDKKLRTLVPLDYSESEKVCAPLVSVLLVPSVCIVLCDWLFGRRCLFSCLFTVPHLLDTTGLALHFTRHLF